MGNPRPVVVDVVVGQSSALPGSAIPLYCFASDSNGFVTAYRWTCDGGAYPDGSCDQQIGGAAGAAILWTAPTDPGTYTLGCTAYDNGGTFGGPLPSDTFNVTIDVVATYSGPTIVAVVTPSTDVVAGSVVPIAATISDPDDSKLTLDWAVTAGVISGHDDIVPAEILWTTPDLAGTAALTLTVTDAADNTASRVIAFSIYLAVPAGAITQMLEAPGRMAVRDRDLAVLDVRRQQVMVFTPQPLLKLAFSVPGVPRAVAADAEGFVTSVAGKATLLTFDRFGRPTGELAEGLAFSSVTDVALDPVTGDFFVVDRGRGAVILVGRDGEEELRIETCGNGVALATPISAARMPDGTIHVARHALTGSNQVCRYDSTGTFLGSRIPLDLGGASGTVAQAVDVIPWTAGRFVLVDAFYGQARVFDAAGTDFGSIGVYGRLAGQLRGPSGAVVDRYGRLFIASPVNRRVERFLGPGAVVPTSPGDADFDDLPDDWELDNGFDPTDPIDAARDTDGDGLVNAEEQELGTDPWLADTDGDGWNDGREFAAGTNPFDPSDHIPVALALVPDAVPPSVITLDGTGSSDPDGDPLVFRWTQLDGPQINLLDADAAVARFVGRRAGFYVLALEIDDGTVPVSETVIVEVLNVPPLPEVDPLITASTGVEVPLYGTPITDANLDPVVVQWSQSDGAAVDVDQWAVPTLRFATDVPGHRTFVVSGFDGELWGEQAVDAVVSDPAAHVPRAAIEVGSPRRVGEELVLSGRTSVDADGETLTYRWSVELAGQALDVSEVLAAVDDAAELRFVPSIAGTYSFSLVVTDARGVSSPPAEEEIVVAAADNDVPVASIDGPDEARILEPLVLDGRGSDDSDGDAIAFAWEQSGGPFVHLADTDGPLLEMWPLDAGVYRFDLRVSDGVHVSLPASHIVVVGTAEGAGRPVAVTTPRIEVEPGETVFLDGSVSWDPDGAPLRFRWTQIAGAWLPLLDGDRAVATLEGLPAGRYRFSLTVDDGVLRSAPVRVEVEVAEPEGPDVPPDEPDEPPEQYRIGGGGGCAATGVGAGWMLLALVLLVGLGRFVRRKGWVLFAALVIIVGPAVARAQWNGSHEAYNSGSDPLTCTDCHIGHNATGPILTRDEKGISNLCLSLCHGNDLFGHFRPFDAQDQANRFARRGVHHRWDSGVAGYTIETSVTNSTGYIVGQGDFDPAIGESGLQYFVITIETNGTPTDATFSWTRNHDVGVCADDNTKSCTSDAECGTTCTHQQLSSSGADVTCGTEVVLDAGVTLTCKRSVTNGTTNCSGGTGTFSFCAGDLYTVYVTDIPLDPSGPSQGQLLGGGGTRMPDGKAVCATCHDHHADGPDAKLSFTTRTVAYPDPGGGDDILVNLEHYMRIDNPDGQLCFECHNNRFPGSTADPCISVHGNLELTRCYTAGKKRSHPVLVKLGANGEGYDRALPIEANGMMQRDTCNVDTCVISGLPCATDPDCNDSCNVDRCVLSGLPCTVDVDCFDTCSGGVCSYGGNPCFDDRDCIHNDLIFDSSGYVTCMTCHSVHAGSADDNSKTTWK